MWQHAPSSLSTRWPTTVVSLSAGGGGGGDETSGEARSRRKRRGGATHQSMVPSSSTGSGGNELLSLQPKLRVVFEDYFEDVTLSSPSNHGGLAFMNCSPPWKEVGGAPLCGGGSQQEPLHSRGFRPPPGLCSEAESIYGEIFESKKSLFFELSKHYWGGAPGSLCCVEAGEQLLYLASVPEAKQALVLRLRTGASGTVPSALVRAVVPRTTSVQKIMSRCWVEGSILKLVADWHYPPWKIMSKRSSSVLPAGKLFVLLEQVGPCQSQALVQSFPREDDEPVYIQTERLRLAQEGNDDLL